MRKVACLAGILLAGCQTTQWVADETHIVCAEDSRECLVGHVAQRIGAPNAELQQAAMAFRSATKHRELAPSLEAAKQVDREFASLLEVSFLLSIYDYDSAISLARDYLRTAHSSGEQFRLLAALTLSTDKAAADSLWREYGPALGLTREEQAAVHDSLRLLSQPQNKQKPWQAIRNDTFRLTLYETALVLTCLETIQASASVWGDASRLGQRLTHTYSQERLDLYWNRLGAACL